MQKYVPFIMYYGSTSLLFTHKLHCLETFEHMNALFAIKVAVQACDHEITRYIKAYLIQTRSTDGNKLYIK